MGLFPVWRDARAAERGARDAQHKLQVAQRDAYDSDMTEFVVCSACALKNPEARFVVDSALCLGCGHNRRAIRVLRRMVS